MNSSMRHPARQVLYLAYGSNLHPQRLGARLSRCTLVARVEIADRRLDFSKRGRDGSGKCTLTELPGHTSFGALFQIPADQIPLLDRIEGGYQRLSIGLDLDGKRQEGFTYLAEPALIETTLLPFDWYLALVTLGARYLGLPPQYQQQLAIQQSRQDLRPEAEVSYQQIAPLDHPDHRRCQHELLEAKLIDWRI
ncbi:gamma-glutamylcyclotransferase [Motiliproteus coralliicola]|uniref:Gamma-glutamylcyclotransferase n=1 Tax=Motiliproteus coralliicola TaxID=2283196 RepID=A0A369WBE0_9GAMM|nr:gamma-glutamylcyclotransferase family protein [Motiliproteus coralliicola]RDE18024.1 gamma-glutamylcyclotransferase [Motiliproteus coralliicola]